MINRVGDNSSYTIPDINREQHHVKKSSEFSLDYGRQEDSLSKNIEESENDDSGVELQLSGISQVHKEETDLPVKEIVIDYPLISSVRDKINEWKDIVLKFLYRVWNGNSDEVITEVGREERIVQKSVKDMTLEEVEEYVSEGGNKTLAKNTDILTTYNQYGKIVDVNPSDRNLIFHGNKTYKDL